MSDKRCGTCGWARSIGPMYEGGCDVLVCDFPLPAWLERHINVAGGWNYSAGTNIASDCDNCPTWKPREP